MILLQAQKEHLANLLTAVQRSAYFLVSIDKRLTWPLRAEILSEQKKDESLYIALSAFNERYAKLQDVIGTAMRHSALLLGERADEYLHVLGYFEKQGVIDSIEQWQMLRLARNQAAHEYETDYEAIADHFNALHELLPVLERVAWRLVKLCAAKLGVGPSDDAFAQEFEAIFAEKGWT